VILVDSTVWIDYFNGVTTPETDFLDDILGDQLILVGDTILAEVLQGFRSDKDFDQAYQALSKFQQVSMMNIDMALKSAQFFRLLRKRGVTIRKTIECFIATFCIQNDYELLHSDRDFDYFEEHLGLKVSHP
jgi:predicted nucleic acid-binding protein